MELETSLESVIRRAWKDKNASVKYVSCVEICKTCRYTSSRFYLAFVPIDHLFKMKYRENVHVSTLALYITYSNLVNVSKY